MFCLLPTSSTASYPAVAGLRLVGYTRLRRCEFTDRLLQHCSCWCTKDSYGQATACMLNAAARVVTGSRKFDRGLGQILHDELHWLDVRDRVFFKLAVIVHRCLNGRAPLYLSDYCVAAAGADTWRQLRSSNRQLLAVPRYRLNTYGFRAFSVAGPTVWKYLPNFIRDRTISADCFRRLHKTYLFARY